MSYSGIELDIFLRENNRSLIEKAVESGDFANLTQEEKDILTNRGYFEKGQLMPFRKLRDVGTGKITFQEACNIEVRVLRRFEKAVGVGSRMTSGRKDQVGVVKRPVGRPRIEMNREIRDMLLRDRNLSTDAHRRMVGHTDGVVVRWRGELGIGKNPVGRPRKSEPSS